MNRIKEFYSKKENYIISFGAFFAIVGLAFPVAIFVLSSLSLSVQSFESLSPIGDYLGGTTASFLALASMLFVVAAIVMQKEELKLQRDELKLTREELEKTREEHSLTNKTMKLQQFESTLFNMISIHGQLINDLKISDNNNPSSGREVIIKHYKRINMEFKSAQFKQYFRKYFNDIKYEETSKKTLVDYLNRVLEYSSERGQFTHGIVKTLESLNFLEGVYLFNYNESIDIHADFRRMVELKSLYPDDEVVKKFSLNFLNPKSNIYKVNALENIKKEHNYILSHYIKSVTSILQLIHSNEIIDIEEKQKYMRLFFSQFTTHEMTIVVYYAILDNQADLQTLLKRYDAIKPEEVMSDAITTI